MLLWTYLVAALLNFLFHEISIYVDVVSKMFGCCFEEIVLNFFNNVSGQLQLVVGREVVDGVEVVEGGVKADHEKRGPDHPKHSGP